MSHYQPFATYPDDVNTVTCTVWGSSWRNFTSTGKLSKTLAVRVAQELENRGVTAVYSKPWGIGGGISSLSFHNFITAVRHTWQATSFIHLATTLRAMRTTYSLFKTWAYEHRDKKIEDNKGGYSINLHVFCTKEMDLKNISQRLMQLNLFAENIGYKFSREMPDYRFTARVSLDLLSSKYSIDIESAEQGSYYSKKLNSWILNSEAKAKVHRIVNKGKFSRVIVRETEYTPFQGRKLTDNEIKKLTYDNDDGRMGWTKADSK